LSGAWLGGENTCAVDPEAARHVLHVDPGEGGAYVLAPVDDPEGPFAGVYWFEDWKVRAARKIRLNRYILPDAPPVLAGAENFYQGNATRGRDVAGYLAAVRAHEHRHGQLMKEALDGEDPARAMEGRSGPDPDRLRKDADERLAKAEARIAQHSRDPLPPSFSEELVVQVMDTGRWEAMRVTVGGDQYGTR
jgi:hypothetical protein